MVCGKGGFKTLARHLKTAHAMTVGYYKKQFDLKYAPSDLNYEESLETYLIPGYHDPMDSIFQQSIDDGIILKIKLVSGEVVEGTIKEYGEESLVVATYPETTLYRASIESVRY